MSPEEKEIRIAGVIRNNVQKSIVAPKALAAGLMGLDEDSFNSIVSDRDFFLTTGCYFGSLWLLRRKVKKVDMTCSSKDNRE